MSSTTSRQAKREEARLAEVLKQVGEFEAQGEELQRRVALIDELRRGQSAPVHIVDQISRSLPEMTWLTSVKQEAFDVTIQGRCMSFTALSDFVGNLEATRYFKRPVEIVSSEVVSRAKGRPRADRVHDQGYVPDGGSNSRRRGGEGRTEAGPGKGGKGG